MSVANNFCDQPLPKYLDLKTVLIYCPHPVHSHDRIFKYMLATYYTVHHTEWYVTIHVIDLPTLKRQTHEIFFRGFEHHLATCSVLAKCAKTFNGAAT